MGWCEARQPCFPVQFLEQFLLSPVRTEDPSEANLFYIPMLLYGYSGTPGGPSRAPQVDSLCGQRRCLACVPWAPAAQGWRHAYTIPGTLTPSPAGCSAGNMMPGQAHIDLVLDQIAHKWPYWNRTRGRDHFYVGG